MNGWNQTKTGIDREYLRRCKESTTEQKLDWLAAALEFVRMTERASAKREPAKRRRKW